MHGRDAIHPAVLEVYINFPILLDFDLVQDQLTAHAH